MEKPYLWHRLMFLYFYGFMPSPTEVVDHIDGDKSNNRLDNLRVTTPRVNNTNKNNFGLVQDQRGNWGFIGFRTREEAEKNLKKLMNQSKCQSKASI